MVPVSSSMVPVSDSMVPPHLLCLIVTRDCYSAEPAPSTLITPLISTTNFSN